MNTERFGRGLALATALAIGLGPALACERGDWSGGTPEVSSVSATGPAAAETIENLTAAFDGESNAHARYLAFAEKADAEGYRGVASLFRAAARAEEIHALNHAAVLRSMSAEPKADVKTPEVKSTSDNLEAAIEGETYERDTMYPGFIRQARDAGNAAAVRTLNLAKKAEAEHATLYQQALANLGAWRGEAKPFYVCSVCGYTATTERELAECPGCFSPKEKFEVVS